MKASANKKKFQKEQVARTAKVYEEKLRKEVAEKRQGWAKRTRMMIATLAAAPEGVLLKKQYPGCILPNPNAPGQRTFSRCAAAFFLEIRQYSCEKSLAQRKNSSLPVTSPVGRIHPKTDPDRGMFVKGTHEWQFAYEAHTACDKHGIVLGVEVTAGNVSDSVAWDAVYDQVTEKFPEVQFVTMDAGYKTPFWQESLDLVEQLRKTERGKELYAMRKETIERVFADAKEKHAMRYTHHRGPARLSAWVGLNMLP